MRNSKTGIEDLIADTNDDSGTEMEDSTTNNRRRDRGPLKPMNSSQAWRTLEDRLNERDLRHRLKEIYDD